jgi:AraC family transcriptional regulator of arabinose operon
MALIRYLFTEPLFRSDGLSIRGIGVREKMRPCIVDRPRGTGDYLFMVFYDEVTIRVAGEPRRYPPGALVMWQPAAGHYYGNLAREFYHSWTHCDGKLLGRFLHENGITPDVPIVLPDPALVDKYLLDLHHELTSHQQPDGVILQNLFLNWIREVARIVKGGGQSETIPRKFLDLKSYIETNYNRPLSLKDLAARVHLSVPHLCACFKQHFGVAVMRYVIQLRLHQAVYLLQDRALNVTEIARQVGYDDIFYFSKLFKTHYGVSPRNARSAAPYKGTKTQRHEDTKCVERVAQVRS